MNEPVSLFEHEAVPLERLGRSAEALRRLDEELSMISRETVLDWSRREYVKAKNFVGVMQAGSLTVEILPKVDAGPQPAGGPARSAARSNLLLMLVRAGVLPVQERDVASLQTERLHLLDAFAVLFGRRLLEELRRGLHRGYLEREGNLTTVRGRILHSQNARLNAVRPDRIYVGYEEFSEDTLLSQTLKAACRALLRRAAHPLAAQVLTECLAMLADVDERPGAQLLTRSILFNRQNQRFEFLTRFAQTVLRGESPNLSRGDARSFSLLVPMELLFEQFIAETIRLHAGTLGLRRCRIRIQAAGDSRALLVRHEAAGDKPAFFLMPDVMIQDRALGESRGECHTTLVLDTKWKRLEQGGRRALDASPADVYQLTAYALRYRCRDNVLLYPASSATARAERFSVDAEGLRSQLRFEFIDVSRDLRWRHKEFLSDLRRVLTGS